ncbi:MAG TPA: hypothetical protein VE912_10295 [Bacteroidales bacterium]|nr:hypothetical protein [Bacteroidales bacterium]
MDKPVTFRLLNKIEDIETSYLFFATLGVSTILIFINLNFNFWIGLLPCIIVFIYSTILFLLQKNHNRIFSQNEKDSPYFIGFTLTLISLGYIFFNLRSLFESDFDKVPQILLTGIVIAITTTIAGLIGRYSIIVSDPKANKQAKLLTIYSNQTEEALSKYINAQEQLIQMVNDFKNESEEVYNDLENIQVQVINKLKKLDSELDSQLTRIGNSLSGSFDFYENEIDNLNERVQKLSSVLENLTAQAEKTNITDSLFGNLKQFNKNSQDVFESVELSIENFSKDINSFHSVVTQNNQNLYQVNKEVLNSLKNAVVSIRQETALTNDSIDQLNSNVDSFAKILKNSEGEIAQTVNSTINKIENGVSRTQRDLNAIDALLDDFIKTVQKHLNHRV